MTYFKYASILIQEMTIEVDEDFLFALLDFSKFSGATADEEVVSYVPSYLVCKLTGRRKLTDEPDIIPEPKGSSSGGDVYFEVLHLQPIQLDLSFMRTDRVNVDQKYVLLFVNLADDLVGSTPATRSRSSSTLSRWRSET